MAKNSIDANAQLLKDIRYTLKHWKKSKTDDYLENLYVTQQGTSYHHGSSNSPTKQLILDAHKELGSQEPDLADILRMRFIEQLGPLVIATELNISENTIYRRQREGIGKLTIIIHRREQIHRQTLQLHFQKRLPPPSYSHLYGTERHIDQLFQLLIARDHPHIISIEGIGGIGKTALGHALTCRAIDAANFTDYSWIGLQKQQLIPDGTLGDPDPNITESSQQVISVMSSQIFSDIPEPTPEQLRGMLYERVKSKRYLIVIDNLETLQDYQALLPLLQDLANPSKFIITSRYHIEASPPIYSYQIPELELSDALKLIRREIIDSGPAHESTLGDAELTPIYTAVGGNPLALKLIVGQLAFAPLNVILEALKEAQGKPIDNLYTFIYKRAWEMLDDNPKEVLLGTLTLPEAGGDFDRLKKATDTTTTALYDALSQLVKMNLVDRHFGSTTEDTWYRIHSLTRAFLYKQVLKWQ